MSSWLHTNNKPKTPLVNVWNSLFLTLCLCHSLYSSQHLPNGKRNSVMKCSSTSKTSSPAVAETTTTTATQTKRRDVPDKNTAAKTRHTYTQVHVNHVVNRNLIVRHDKLCCLDNNNNITAQQKHTHLIINRRRQNKKQSRISSDYWLIS